MSKKNRVFSEDEKKAVRESIKNKIKQVEDDLLKKNLKEAKDMFIEKFTLCEKVYKIVLKQYLKNKEKYQTDEKMKLNIMQIRASLSRAGYQISEDLLNKIFSTVGVYATKGSRSAKLLRNDIDHELSHSALQEIFDRNDELISYMDEFLQLMQEDYEVEK